MGAPWGKLISITGSMASTIGVQNPYRYRAYRYDTELEMYYLNSRYYDPEIGRFINADDVGVIGTTPWTLTDKNLYAYCDNNPVNRRDSGGYLWETVLDIISLGFSIYDVVSNPSDPLAWLGLAGDIIDVAVPFVAGVGEIVRACKVVDTAAEVIDTSKDAAKIIDNVGEVVNTTHDLTKTGNSVSKPTKSIRSSAVKKAWKNEVYLVETTGTGTRNWTPSEIDELLTKGKVKGYEGHHMKSVSFYPDLAGDPHNIQFLTRKEHFAAHNGNWRNITHGRYLP